jgi:hypothetical protein
MATHLLSKKDAVERLGREVVSNLILLTWRYEFEPGIGRQAAEEIVRRLYFVRWRVQHQLGDDR